MKLKQFDILPLMRSYHPYKTDEDLIKMATDRIMEGERDNNSAQKLRGDKAHVFPWEDPHQDNELPSLVMERKNQDIKIEINNPLPPEDWEALAERYIFGNGSPQPEPTQSWYDVQQIDDNTMLQVDNTGMYQRMAHSVGGIWNEVTHITESQYDAEAQVYGGYIKHADWQLKQILKREKD